MNVYDLSRKRSGLNERHRKCRNLCLHSTRTFEVWSIFTKFNHVIYSNYWPLFYIYIIVKSTTCLIQLSTYTSILDTQTNIRKRKRAEGYDDSTPVRGASYEPGVLCEGLQNQILLWALHAMAVTGARFGAWKVRVEWSLLRLFKAKEGSRKHEAIRMPRFANLALSVTALHVPAPEQ